MNNAIAHAAAIAGGQSALAKELRHLTPNNKISQGHVWSWINRSGRVPAEYCAAIEKLTGVTKEQLRPDIFPNIAHTSHSVNPHNIAGTPATDHKGDE